MDASESNRKVAYQTRTPRKVKVVLQTVETAHCITDRGHRKPQDQRRVGRGLSDRLIVSAKKAGIKSVKLHRAVMANRWGLQTRYTYEVDNPGSGYRIGPKEIGIYLSHWTLWSHLEKLGESAYFIVEDDSVFRPGFMENLEKAAYHLPEDWDIIYVGSCCTKNKVFDHLGGNLYDVRYPACTHAMVIRHKTLRILLDELQKADAPVDLALSQMILPQLKSFTILPRLVDQSTSSSVI